MLIRVRVRVHQGVCVHVCVPLYVLGPHVLLVRVKVPSCLSLASHHNANTHAAGQSLLFLIVGRPNPPNLICSPSSCVYTYMCPILRPFTRFIVPS